MDDIAEKRIRIAFRDERRKINGLGDWCNRYES